MIVAMPSKGRPSGVKSAKVIPGATVFVPDYEAADYRACGVGNVESVPNKIDGITATRNWILDNTDDSRVVFIDDDVVAHGWFELQEHQGKQRRLSETQWVEEWEKLFDVAEGMGLRVWGVNSEGALRSVYPYKPFLWHTYLTASCMGILNNGLRFDESFKVKEDYELGLRCLHEDGAIVGCRYLFWRNAHWDGEGGCKDYRTGEMELTAIMRLARKYPGYIRQVTKGGSSYSIVLNL